VSEVLIAGGGLAGSAVAIQLGRLGISVELFERGSFPKENPCGEGLMPAGVAALERLGLNTEKGAPFSGVRYHFGRRIAEGRFPEAHGVLSLGRGFRRRDLDTTLFELARRTPNVKVHTEAIVEAPLIEGGCVVGLYRWLTALLVSLAQKPAFLVAALEVSRLLPRLFSHFLGVAAGTHRCWGAEVVACSQKCHGAAAFRENGFYTFSPRS